MKKYARYFLYLAIFLVLDLALDRRLVFWEWVVFPGWLGVWFKNLSLTKIGLHASLLAASIGLLQLSMSKNTVARILVFVCNTISLAFLAFFIIIEERMPDITDVAISFEGLADFTRIGITVFQTYTRTTVFALLAGGLITAELMLIGRRAAKQPSPVPAWLAMLLLCGAIIFCSRLDNTGRASPLYIKTPALVLNGLAQSFSTYRGPRADPELLPLDAGSFRSHILLIVDESVAGFALGVNGCKYATTPFLSAKADPFFNNYGIASSGGNYSSISNFLLVSGLRPDQIPDYSQVSLRSASIFGHAKKAGRGTFYVDAQNTRLKNLMTAADLLDMEYVSTVDDSMPLHQQDRLGMRKAAEIMRASSEPTFVFLLKTGLHVPFVDKFPPPREKQEWGAKSGLVEGYFNGIAWAVDDFFKELENQLKGQDVIVVYTSDHGIDFDLETTSEVFDGAKLLYGTRTDPPTLQASVPLFVWPISDRALEEYRRAGGFKRTAFNRMSHFQLFPTLLTLMGYEQEAVRARFGGTFFDPPPEKRVFTTREFLEVRGGIDENATWLYPFE